MTGKIAKVSITVGLAGLVWSVTEAVISRLEREELRCDIEAITTNDIYRRMEFEEKGDNLRLVSGVAKKVRALNPLGYLIPYARRFYALGSYKGTR